MCLGNTIGEGCQYWSASLIGPPVIYHPERCIFLLIILIAATRSPDVNLTYIWVLLFMLFASRSKKFVVSEIAFCFLGKCMRDCILRLR